MKSSSSAATPLEFPATSAGEHQLGLLRFSTCGSVDDGKSTLVGRLLHDSKNILDDQLVALEKASAKHERSGSLALALVTDGLKAEREQGITIDVAYRYFGTARRRFILADTPGHEQYTRNMATGASTADVAIVLVDATKGIITQTKRHSFISSLLGVPRILVAVNKMDLVGFRQEVFEKIRADYLEFAERLRVRDIRFIPISALQGDNVVTGSTNMPWYHGESVLEYLETVYVGSDRNRVDFRFPVQLVIRGDGTLRCYAGQIASGSIRVGEEVVVLPGMQRSKVRSIEVAGKEYLATQKLESAAAPRSVMLTLEDEIDISRGDAIARVGNVPRLQTKHEAVLLWMSEEPFDAKREYLVMHTAHRTKASIDSIRYRIDVNTLSRLPGAALQLNEIGRVSFQTARPLAVDSYERNRSTGSFIVIDSQSGQTVAAGMLIDALATDMFADEGETSRTALNQRPMPENLHREKSSVTPLMRATRTGRKAVTVWCTGLSGSGKSTIAREAEHQLWNAGWNVFVLDGDNVRHGLNRDLGFSEAGRTENIRRVAEVAKLMNDAGVTVLCAFISPFERDRAMARDIIGAERFVETYIATPLDECERRDPHGLYRKARAGEIKGFTGVDAPYEAPKLPELTVHPEQSNVDSCVKQLVEYLARTCAVL